LNTVTKILYTAEAEGLGALGHQVCPYSNATRGNIPVTLIVEEASPSTAATSA